jgi:hypothetical protein
MDISAAEGECRDGLIPKGIAQSFLPQHVVKARIRESARCLMKQAEPGGAYMPWTSLRAFERMPSRTPVPCWTTTNHRAGANSWPPNTRLAGGPARFSHRPGITPPFALGVMVLWATLRATVL